MPYFTLPSSLPPSRHSLESPSSCIPFSLPSSNFPPFFPSLPPYPLHHPHPFLTYLVSLSLLRSSPALPRSCHVVSLYPCPCAPPSPGNTPSVPPSCCPILPYSLSPSLTLVLVFLLFLLSIFIYIFTSHSLSLSTFSASFLQVLFSLTSFSLALPLFVSLASLPLPHVLCPAPPCPAARRPTET